MKFSSIVAALGCAAAVGGVHTRPWELVLRTDPLRGRCELVSFRLAQINKELLTQQAIVQASPVLAPHPGETRSVLRAVSHDVRLLLSHVQPYCSNDLSAALPGIGFPSIQLPLSQGDTPNPRVLEVDLPSLELVPLITSGPAENRVNLAFFADGYTAGERRNFLADVSRLARDLSTNQTFFTVKPLLNFWAVFSPSKESGVGVGGKAKDTPFGLYRDGTELRGLYANNSDVALAACASLGDKCNYAVLLANDPLYGGLGGEYTTTTASLANGALVLRHEIGHSIIDVGEEYDGGFAYFGVNAVHDPHNVTWAHWLTDKDHLRVERSSMSMQSYPWTLLNAEQPWSIAFSSPGTYARHLVKFSLSGVPRADDLAVYLDGTDLGWIPRHDIGVDRWHYDIFFEHALAEGEHVLEFALQNRKIQGQAQLCSVEVLEYGTPKEFDATRGYYSLFPTYDLDNATSYRPTNDDCLMRSVVQPNLCSVCMEALWRALLKRVDLIDDVRVTCSTDRTTVVDVDLVQLAQFREHPIANAESYTIAWTRNGRVLESLANRTRVELGDGEGAYRVDVAYTIDQVQRDPGGYLRASRTLDVTPHSCQTVV